MPLCSRSLCSVSAKALPMVAVVVPASGRDGAMARGMACCPGPLMTMAAVAGRRVPPQRSRVRKRSRVIRFIWLLPLQVLEVKEDRFFVRFAQRLGEWSQREECSFQRIVKTRIPGRADETVIA